MVHTLIRIFGWRALLKGTFFCGCSSVTVPFRKVMHSYYTVVTRAPCTLAKVEGLSFILTNKWMSNTSIQLCAAPGIEQRTTRMCVQESTMWRYGKIASTLTNTSGAREYTLLRERITTICKALGKRKSTIHPILILDAGSVVQHLRLHGVWVKIDTWTFATTEDNCLLPRSGNVDLSVHTNHNTAYWLHGCVEDHAPHHTRLCTIELSFSRSKLCR